jgi:LmbE family N-acetylglucosaminyl deacetylase
MNFNKNTKLLVVVAHPDDETLGCGGVILKAKEAGATVAVLFLGEGVSARFSIDEYHSDEFKEQTKKRMKEAEQALKVLGVDEYKFSKRLCTQFDTYPLLDLVKEIESYMQFFKPTIILTHNESEVNIDHKITYNAVEVACRPTRSFTPNEIYSFEIICSGSFKFLSSFHPNVYIDIEKYWNKKIEAWSCYEGESKEFPFPRSNEGLKILSGYRGLSSGLKLSEAFRLERMIVKN